MYYLWSWHGIIINKVFVSSVKFLFCKKDDTFFDITLVQQLSAQSLVTFNKVWVAAASSRIPNESENVYFICRRSWYIATKVGEIDNFKIKIVSFVIDSGTEMTRMSNSRYKSKNETLNFSSGGYFDGT